MKRIFGKKRIIILLLFLSIYHLFAAEFLYTNQKFVLHEKTISRYESRYGHDVRKKLNNWVNLMQSHCCLIDIETIKAAEKQQVAFQEV